jgi:hypothetical protein
MPGSCRLSSRQCTSVGDDSSARFELAAAGSGYFSHPCTYRRTICLESSAVDQAGGSHRTHNDWPLGLSTGGSECRAAGPQSNVSPACAAVRVC